jgi:predicted DCC family thiol-disulfide oxidoreductase YuxK
MAKPDQTVLTEDHQQDRDRCAVPGDSASRPDVWEIRVLFDGECPLCTREIRLLERLDAGRKRIAFEDLSSSHFEPSDYGLDQATVEARIHGVLPDGRVVEGVEVFARAYSAVGVTWLATLSEWPGFRWVLDRLYVLFAKNRLRLTGRAPKQCVDVEEQGGLR